MVWEMSMLIMSWIISLFILGNYNSCYFTRPFVLEEKENIILIGLLTLFLIDLGTLGDQYTRYIAKDYKAL